jgi:hypothetical protein
MDIWNNTYSIICNLSLQSQNIILGSSQLPILMKTMFWNQVDLQHCIPSSNTWTNEMGEWSLEPIFEEVCECRPTWLGGLCGASGSDFYFNSFRQLKLRFSMEWQSYLYPWIWMNHVGGRWNNIYSSKLGTFILKWSDTISRFGSILAISSTLKLGISLWKFPLYRFWAINRPKKNAG